MFLNLLFIYSRELYAELKLLLQLLHLFYQFLPVYDGKSAGTCSSRPIALLGVWYAAFHGQPYMLLQLVDRVNANVQIISDCNLWETTINLHEIDKQ